MGEKTLFYILFAIAQLCGLVSLIFLIIYLTQDGRSLAWEGYNKVWIHTFVSWLGLIYFFGIGISLYRVLTMIDKNKILIVHVVIHVGILAMNIIGLITIMDVKPSKHFQTAHGALGLITYILFGVLIILSLIIYLIPQISDDIKQKFSPFHVNIALATFLFAIVTTVSGLNIFTKLWASYEILTITILSVAYVAITFVILITPEFKGDG